MNYVVITLLLAVIVGLEWPQAFLAVLLVALALHFLH
jgi:hypothetical protein